MTNVAGSITNTEPQEKNHRGQQLIRKYQEQIPSKYETRKEPAPHPEEKGH